LQNVQPDGQSPILVQQVLLKFVIKCENICYDGNLDWSDTDLNDSINFSLAFLPEFGSKI